MIRSVIAALVLAVVACADPPAGPEPSLGLRVDAVVVENASPTAIIVVALDGELLPLADPNPQLVLAPNADRVLGPGAASEIEVQGSYAVGDAVALLVYRAVEAEGVAILTTIVTVEADELARNGGRIRIESAE